ncbi:unnamed protein product [Ectocarpus sp. CCAP 1310/34]|nr:unnamed protein product [Ectocarpus sp. CCAP 1310/34]
MSSYGGENRLRSPRKGSGAKRGSEDEGAIATASLQVLCAAATEPRPNLLATSAGPTMYEAVYTRGGWIWRTSHRYSDWLSLKERLRADFGKRNLPDDELFPQKEDVGAIIGKVLSSCQGCREGGSRAVGHIEERRRGLQAYFSQVLDEQRELWDSSADIEAFFSPGPPTSYSAALSRRRSEQLKEEKLKAKEASSAASIMASSLKSTLGSLFETSPATTPSAAAAGAKPSFSTYPFSASSSARSTSASSSMFSPRLPEDQWSASASSAAAGPGVGAGGRSSGSVISRLAAMKKQMPSLRDLLFDDAPPPPTPGSVNGSINGSRASSRHNKIPSSTNKPPSESGATDPDGGISEAGGSKHSIICE